MADQNSENSELDEAAGISEPEHDSTTNDRLDDIYGEQIETRLTLRDLTHVIRNIDKKLVTVPVDKECILCNELKSKIKEHEEKLDRVQAEFKDQQKKLKDKNEELVSKVRELRKKLDEKDQQINNLKTNKDALGNDAEKNNVIKKQQKTGTKDTFDRVLSNIRKEIKEFV